LVIGGAVEFRIALLEYLLLAPAHRIALGVYFLLWLQITQENMSLLVFASVLYFL